MAAFARSRSNASASNSRAPGDPQPLQHPLVLVVGRVGEHASEFLVSGEAADVLGWAASGAVDAPWRRVAVRRGCLEDDEVAPAIAEVVLVVQLVAHRDE